MAERFKGPEVVLDLETESSKSLTRDGLWAYAGHGNITTSAICIDDGEVRSLDERQALVALDEMEKRDVPYRLICHNVSFERCWLEFRARRFGLARKGPFIRNAQWVCTQLMARSLNLPASLKDLCRFLWPDEEGKDEEGHALVSDDSGMGSLLDNDPEKIRAYCRKDVELTRKAYRVMLPHVSELDIELAGVDSSINLRGLPVDKALCERMLKTVEAERLELHEWARSHYPGVFTSQKWSLGQVEKVKELIAKLRKDGTHKAADELQARRDRYGSLVNAEGKWAAGVKAADGRARCCFVPRATQSGRFAGRSMQPQNLIRNTGDPKLDTRAVVNAGPGRKILSADYSQIELTLMLWLSGLKDELRFVQGGGDFYMRCAEMAFGQSTPERRFLLKGACLGLGYGMGKRSAVSKMVEEGASEADAVKVWGFLAKTILPSYKKLWEKIAKVAGERTGSKFADEGETHSHAVLPVWRRKVVWRGLDGSCSSYMENKKGSFAPGKWWPGNATSHVVSGTAADIMVAAIVSVDRELRDRGMRSKVIGSCHDELLIECLEDEVDDCLALVNDVMPGVFSPLRLRVNACVGQSWAEAK